MKKFTRWLIDMFSLSKTEVYGLWILIILIVLFALVPRWYFYHRSPQILHSDTVSLKKWADSINNFVILNKAPQISNNSKNETAFKVQKRNLDHSSQQTISTKKKAVYNDSKQPTITEKPKTFRIEKFNINAADTTELKQIRGIGKVLSKRIIRYRDLVGGFHSRHQLYEVYGLDSAVVLQLSLHCWVDEEITRLNINTDSINYLKQHPYISYKTAKLIVNYRKSHGDYKDISEIRNIKIITDSLYQKISPYLSISSKH